MARTEEWRRLEGRAYRGFSMSWLIGKCSWGLLLPAVAYWLLADAGMAARGPSCMFGGPLADPPIESLGLAVAFGVALLLSARALGDWLYARAELAAGELARMAPALPRRVEVVAEDEELPRGAILIPDGEAAVGSCADRLAGWLRGAGMALRKASLGAAAGGIVAGLALCAARLALWAVADPGAFGGPTAPPDFSQPMLWCAEWTAILAFGAWMNGRLLCWGASLFEEAGARFGM